MVLSKREKVLIALLGVVVLLGLVYFGLSGLKGYRDRLEREVAASETTLREMGRISAALAAASRGPSRRGGSPALIGRVETLARAANVDENLQLNLLPQDRNSGMESAEVRVDGMTLDELVGFFHAIEDARPPIGVDHVELSPAFRDKTRLRATLRLIAPK